MMASAYVNGANQASESRLVSPVLDLTGKNSVILTFDHTFKTFAADTHLEDLKLEVREEGGRRMDRSRHSYLFYRNR